MQLFQPSAPTVSIAAGAASASVALGTATGATQVRVVNDGTATAWVNFGVSGVTASLTTSMPVRSGDTVGFTISGGVGAPFAAVIAVGATGSVYFTLGTGF